MTTNPQAVIFDLGKVLVDFDYGIAVRELAARSTMSLGDIKNLINQSPLLFQYETGLMSRQQFFDAVQAATGFKHDIHVFSGLFADIFKPMDSMIELHAALRKKGVPTFIFSNTNDLAINHIKKSYPFFSNFDGYIYSYEHGAMKPHSKLYEVVERVTNLNGDRLLYIDDRPENIETGKARGWQVILQETPEKTIAEIKRIGLL